MNTVASLKKTTKMNTGILTGVNVRWPLRVGLMMCPLYSYSEEKNYEFSTRLFIRDGASVQNGDIRFRGQQ
ncbi:hypothetical protein [Escherichia phage EC.W2-6]|uniref:Uncharacterized protein n=1 Tax=Escherichia phage EC.W8-1 TaxID=3236638 RepID=A0AB39CBP1_9CAUD